MDALLLCFIICALTTANSRLPHMFVTAKLRMPAPAKAPALALTLAVATLAAVAAVAGGLLAHMMTPEARALFLACAFVVAGIGILARGHGESRLEKRLLSRATGSFAAYIAAGISDSAPLVITAIAASFSDPWMAGIGGGGGIMAACVLLPQFEAIRPSEAAIRTSRFAVATVALIAAFIVAVQGLHLI